MLQTIHQNLHCFITWHPWKNVIFVYKNIKSYEIKNKNIKIRASSMAINDKMLEKLKNF